ncbi:hypothetical protein LPJ63_005154 [Coemansia sp. RSA 2711]|nr:hypothetical protein LPJ63_005154 [Coemansia sp. RSA 2711]KAJ2320370.1 hypothetical protein IWW52_001413 [Coemansia sp. RSA 2704]KAJ2385416.1 hypothetical protein H4S02_004335 [Coemansia sp. RSA 2611]
MNLPGMREEECFAWAAGGAAGSQEYLQGLVRQARFDVSRQLAEPANTDRLQWLFEHLRQICVELGFFVSQLHGECTHQTCPVMRANETTYYCAGNHGHPRPCSAIAYAVHTLDFAERQLSRAGGEQLSLRHFQSMVRRLYRVFGHAYFHHRELFERRESATYLYARFVRLARKYELAPESQIIIPDLPTTVEPQ